MCIHYEHWGTGWIINGLFYGPRLGQISCDILLSLSATFGNIMNWEKVGHKQLFCRHKAKCASFYLEWKSVLIVVLHLSWSNLSLSCLLCNDIHWDSFTVFSSRGEINVIMVAVGVVMVVMLTVIMLTGCCLTSDVYIAHHLSLVTC